MSKELFHYSPSEFYNKAEDISSLSRRISEFLIVDLAGLKDRGLEAKEIYFTGDIIRQSFFLGPTIVKAEQSPLFEQKKKYLAVIKNLIQKLSYSCKRLEKCNSNGTDYLKLLKKELDNFKKLHKYWSLNL